MKKLIAILLAGLVLAGCGATTDPPEVTQPEITETTMSAEDAQLLQERRDAAESYMRDMATVLWRATEDMVYTTDSSLVTEADVAAYAEEKSPMVIRAGRLYRGIPYSYAGSAAGSFYQFFGERDEKGYPTVSGLNWRSLNGSASKAVARVGNDCSGSLQLAWESVGGNFKPASTANMTLTYGYIPVGDYETEVLEYVDTPEITERNGGTVMFEAYAQLQKADAVVRREDGAGHTMMISSVHVEYSADGDIDGMNSYITVLHQTSSYLKKEAYEYDETIGEDVYQTYGVDDKYTFMNLLGSGYLPVTCDVFVDPDATPKEAWFKDSETEYTKENIFAGKFTSNSIMAYVTITVTDANGQEVGKQTCFYKRQSLKEEVVFDLTMFETEEEFNKRGQLNLNDLAPGTYHCTHVLTDAHGNEHVMREFDFTVE